MRTAQDVEESTKHVNVEGKREALLASSAAAEEATKVSIVFGIPAGDFFRAEVAIIGFSFLADEAIPCRKEKRWKTNWST